MPGVVELVVLCGFYEMIAGVIFAFDVPLPEGAPDPLGATALIPIREKPPKFPLLEQALAHLG